MEINLGIRNVLQMVLRILLGISNVEVSMGTRLLRFLVPILIMLSLGCTSRDASLEKYPSSDSRFWAELRVNRSAGVVGGDWYFVVLHKENPTTMDTLLGRGRSDICVLQGPGTLKVSWNGSRQLTVTCSNCRQGTLDMQRDVWQGVSVKYVFD